MLLNFTGDKTIQDFMNKTYGKNFTYRQFAPLFKADKFNPDEWADLFFKAGAKLVYNAIKINIALGT